MTIIMVVGTAIEVESQDSFFTSHFFLCSLPFWLPFLAFVGALIFYYIRVNPFVEPPLQNVAHVVQDFELDPLLQTSATELARHIKNGVTTSTTLTNKYIAHMTKVNTALNAVAHYRFAQALREAADCDKVIAAYTARYFFLRRECAKVTGEEDDLDTSFAPHLADPAANPATDWDRSSPVLASIVDPTQLVITPVPASLASFPSLYSFLHQHLPPFFGVPCTTKECFALVGMPHTSGLVSRHDVTASYTAPVILNMQRAGLVIMGTTNTSELCMWIESYNRVAGLTNNPHNLRCAAGGSSGGEGSIIGGGASPLALGSDVGGSIRVPSFFNGIYGHKPTSGYVSNAGQWPPSRGVTELYCQPGPMCRYPADLWPLLQVMLQSHTQPVAGTVADTADGARCVTLMPRVRPAEGKVFAFSGRSPHGELVADDDVDEPTTVVAEFKTYPHDVRLYGHEDARVIATVDKDAPDVLVNTHSTLPLHRVVPWDVDVSRLVVYSLENFGKASAPCSPVDPRLVRQQRAAAEHLCKLGCEVRLIDVEKLAADAEDAVVVHRWCRERKEVVLSNLGAQEKASLRFLVQLRDAFKMWSSGMDASDGPRFRDMLLQPYLGGLRVDAATDAVQAAAEGHGFVHVMGGPKGISLVDDSSAGKNDELATAEPSPSPLRALWRALVKRLNLSLSVPLIVDDIGAMETKRQGNTPIGKTTLSAVPTTSGPQSWAAAAWNEVKITLFFLMHCILFFFRESPLCPAPCSDPGCPLARAGSRSSAAVPPPAQRRCRCTAVISSSAPTPTFFQRLCNYLPSTPFTLPALLLALIERVPEMNPKSTELMFAQLQGFSVQLSELLLSHEHGAVLICPPHTRQAPPHQQLYQTCLDFVYTGLFNATRMPVTSVPLGFEDNMPTGIQVAGARHSDNLTIAVALALHARFGGWKAPVSPYADKKRV